MTKLPVLVVSEDGDVTGTFRELCKKANLDCLVCMTIESFITACMHQRFNVAIFDLSLFRRHNLRLTEILKKSLQDLVIVIVSTGNKESEREIIEADLAHKVLYRLVKPFTRNEAKSVVDALAKFQGS